MKFGDQPLKYLPPSMDAQRMDDMSQALEQETAKQTKTKCSMSNY